MLSTLGVVDATWLATVSSHHEEGQEAVQFPQISAVGRLTRILKVVDRYAAMISPRMSRSGRSATESARSIMADASSKTDAIGHALVRAVGLCPPGTYVRMDSDELAVVLRRSSRPNQPFVAIVGRPNGDMLHMPRLHATAESTPHIRAALPASSVRTHLNHFHILQLGAHATA
jgi:hypothetical protein